MDYETATLDELTDFINDDGNSQEDRDAATEARDRRFPNERPGDGGDDDSGGGGHGLPGTPTPPGSGG